MDNERAAWLKGLKVGDTVALMGTSGFKRTLKVERITDTGRIKTDCAYEFNPDGYERGGSSRWGRDSIAPYSKEIQEGVERRRLTNHMDSGVNWRAVSLTKLREIDAILKRDDSGDTGTGGG